ncbi:MULTISPECIES: hypothetical protein [unclassified Oceanobacter]|uniref:hypothetical protein n=1 Tax=unclassified Oceanobacter TaxID=2620260 RepID=UPI002734B4E6|nr:MULTISPECIES: hypothetical protein [unclassified Oceanobacter]MDP2609772.1 hypothetical protein [Oceanobacter sp. 1_MG-2023]MDP2613103.1 hypothetical protein [Oceanobacter sp. 2_MG-2023]
MLGYLNGKQWLARSRLLVALLGSLLASEVVAAKLYRFKVDGQTVLRDRIPAELVGQGYEVLGSNGMVLEVVAPAPTEEELVIRRAREAAELQRQEQIAQQKEADINLLRLYEQPSDVERARLRKSEEVATYITLQERRQQALEEKLQVAQQQAERFTSKGYPVPEDIQDEVDEIVDVIADSQRDIRDRRAELGRITRDYAEQYERIRILQVYPPGTLYDEVDFDRVDRFIKATPPVSR